MKQQLSYFLIFSFLLLLSSCKDDPAPLANADFYADGDGCTASCKVHFYDQSKNAVKWQWSFGNGFSSTKPNDSTAYANGGVYNVKLIVWNKDDVADSILKTITINE
ncbi:MAG: PKD domain-containing protein [Flavobacteriales bacterium]|jgi:PKD repeat protein|nr:PKD domain-containing protein [Flavobacteriales bacterium]